MFWLIQIQHRTHLNLQAGEKNRFYELPGLSTILEQNMPMQIIRTEFDKTETQMSIQGQQYTLLFSKDLKLNLRNNRKNFIAQC